MSERRNDDSGGRGESAPASAAARSIDPFDRIYNLGHRESIKGGMFGIVFACSSHLGAILIALTVFQGARALAATTSELEIEVAAPAATPPPPPPLAPPNAVAPPDPTPPPPAPKANKQEKEDPYEENDLPPPPSEAAKVLTAPEQPNDPPAPADQTFASGNGTGLGVGYVAGSGSGNGTTYDPRATVGNKIPTKRPEPRPDAPQGYADLSRPASPYYGVASGCDFPSGVDDETAVVPVIVTVGADGNAISVEVLQDPGRGFGAAARRCAMNTKYRPGRDATGKLIVSKTPPVRVRFTR